MREPSRGVETSTTARAMSDQRGYTKSGSSREAGYFVFPNVSLSPVISARYEMKLLHITVSEK